jgi:hypothetical protein
MKTTPLLSLGLFNLIAAAVVLTAFWQAVAKLARF